MAFKIANKSEKTLFVIQVNGGALWEFEPSIWRTVDFLSDREWEAITPYLGTSLVHNSADPKRKLGLSTNEATDFPADNDYDKVSETETPSKGELASGKTLEETWELTKATLKVEGNKVKVGQKVTPTVEGLKGFKIVNGARKGSEAEFKQGYKIERLSSDSDKVKINEKTMTIEGVAAATGVKVKAEIVATGNDKGKVEAEATIAVEA